MLIHYLSLFFDCSIDAETIIISKKLTRFFLAIFQINDNLTIFKLEYSINVLKPHSIYLTLVLTASHRVCSWIYSPKLNLTYCDNKIS